MSPSIDDLRRAIPPHCFRPSLWKSLSYVARDITLAYTLGSLANEIPTIPWLGARVLAWIIYGYLQGLVFTGLWILAHECGHGSFSAHQHFNNILGWILHSFLLVPYFSWRLSHQRHHMYNAHMDKDTAHVPPRLEEAVQQHDHDEYNHPAEDMPVWSAIRLIGHQLLGFPLYFLFYLTAGKKSMMRGLERKWYNSSHFYPWSVVFRSSNRSQILISDAGLLMAVQILRLAATQLSWSRVSLLYFVPYLWVNHWIVAITLLHHSHPDVPKYEADSWTYLDGALSTVDRHYGWIGQHMFHNIIDFHVIHHLFPKIPFYHAAEATAAISPLLGARLLKERGSFHGELWRTFRNLRWVEARQHPLRQGTIRVWNRG